MARIDFTPNLRRHVDCPPAEIEADSVARLLAAYFAEHPAVRGFVLDDQGGVRHHVKILIDGRNIRDRNRQTDAITAASEIYIFQALSGG